MRKQQPTEKAQNKNMDSLQQYYEQLPYPMRDPEEETQRLLSTTGENLAELNHWLYRGKEDFKSGFRILVAGGGTGDAAIFLAEQLKDSNAEIVYLDFSQASMEIAQKRAEVRGLKNITWIRDSILNIPSLNLGKFDYINCVGVLHHFTSPVEGLKILKDSLTENGGIGFQIYAKYGRTAVTQMQQMMKMVNSTTTNVYKSLMNAKIMLQALPPTNWFMRSQELIQDHTLFGDTGLHGMFLQPDDHTLSIPELYELTADAGLNLIEFNEPKDRLLLKIDNYIQDVELVNAIKKMDVITQQAICELMIGNIIKHGVYLSNRPDSIASIEDLDNVPFLFRADGLAKSIYEACSSNQISTTLILSFDLPWVQGLPVRILNDQYTKYIFKYLDGAQSLHEIFDAINEELKQNINDEILIKATQKAFAPLIEVGILLLRDKSIN